MNSTYSRRNLPDELRNVELWRAADFSQITDDKAVQHAYALQRAVTLYVGMEVSVLAIEASTGLSRKQILRAVNRCLRLAGDGKPFGWAALTPQLRVMPYTRVKFVESNAPDRGGYAGAFTQLLVAHPVLRENLSRQVRGLNRHLSPLELHQNLESIHRKFLTWCTDVGVRATEYPFSVESKGRRSLTDFVRFIRQEYLNRGLVAQNRKSAAGLAKLGLGEGPKLFATAPFDVAQMDAHRIDVIGTVRVPLQVGHTLVPIQRLSVVLICDVRSQAALGYAIVIRREANRFDVLRSLNAAITTWEPRKPRMPGLTYGDGAGFPSAVIPELAGVVWAVLQVDNALVHYSDALIDRGRKRVGFAINFGPFARWDRRPIIENIFGRLERMGFHRVVSSTGTGPEDPTISNPNAAAVEHEVLYEDLIDLIDIVIANYNATRVPAMGMKSPLDVLRDFAAASDRLFLPRQLPPALGATADLSTVVEFRPVSGNAKEGRRPFIKIDTVIYRNAALSDMVSLIGQKLIVHVNERDMRVHQLFLPDGRALGELIAEPRWNQAPWTREEGKLIRSQNRRDPLAPDRCNDPVDAFHSQLAADAQRDAAKQRAKSPKTSAAATKIAELVSEGRASPTLTQLQPVNRPTQFGAPTLPLGRFASIAAPQRPVEPQA